jgi:hypothetical protein
MSPRANPIELKVYYYCGGVADVPLPAAGGLSSLTSSNCWVVPSAKCINTGAVSCVKLLIPVSMIGRV